ncbi:galactonate operon transcriptional repressor [Klebsiella variicola]|uniref:Galactonate operon transcriptional repressor n=1 Tax=Klebsiella variicola TaxID=244366 RepID=A0A7H4MML7_KLEVA|nr:galactonate operon transcriptional repressor [Klebsiella variicola]
MNLTKTDRLMVTLGRQIVSGKYLPGAAAAGGG